MNLLKTLCFALVGFSTAQAIANSGSCVYNLDQKTVHVGWTAFKTTKKVGVNGSFQKVEVKGAKQASSLEKALQKIDVVVDTSSLDTGNPARDLTLKEFFFQKLADGAITGTVKNFSEKNKTFTLVLKFNGEVHDVPMTYTSDKNDFTATGEMDVLNFHANSALESLNQKCVDLHKGPDGVSKTWSTVELKLQGQVTSTCK